MCDIVYSCNRKGLLAISSLLGICLGSLITGKHCIRYLRNKAEFHEEDFSTTRSENKITFDFDFYIDVDLFLRHILLFTEDLCRDKTYFAC